MKTKKIVLAVLIILVNVVIFMFSGQDGKTSESVSDKVTITVIDKYAEIKDKTYTEPQKNKIVKDVRFFVRKSAHFSIYFVLGVLVYLFIGCYDVKKPLILAIIVSIMFAGLDEFHQLFSPGRTARLYDVLIDTLGSSVGMFVVIGIDKIKHRIGSKKDEKQRF